MRTVAELVSGGTLAELIPVQASVERKHTLQFARVESNCLGGRWDRQKSPPRFGRPGKNPSRPDTEKNMKEQTEDTAGLKHALNETRDRTEELQADSLLTRILVSHLIGLVVRRDGDPTKTLEVLRVSSRRNLAENIGWTSGEAEGNERLRSKALEKHEQFFEEMKHALGQHEG